MPSPKAKMMDYVNEENVDELNKKKILQNISMFGQKANKLREQ